MTRAAAIQLDDLFAEWDRPGSPGCAVAVYDGGEIAFAGGFGLADLERDVPITSRSVFDIGSTSKQFTAACVLLLAREGALSLDGDVKLHLPGLPDLGGPVTVRHLVHHTSGWRDYLNLTILAGRSIDNDYEESEVMALLARQGALDFAPGTRHSYSNTGYFLLGEVMRAATGRSLREIAQERIFGPLGMDSTFFHDDRSELVPGRALAYAPSASGFRHDVSIWDVVGDGAVFTSVEDLARWDRQFYECELAGGQDLISELTAPGRLVDGTELDYAFGLSIGAYRGARTISHGGSWGGYRAELLRFPELRTSVAVLANLASVDAGGLARRVADRVLDGRLQPPGAAEEPATGEGSAEAFAGTYLDAERTLVILVDQAAGGTVARLAGQEFPLLPIDGGRALLAGLPVELRLEGDGLQLLIAGEDTMALRRVAPGAIDLDSFAGRYRSEELEAVYEIARDGGGLALRRGHQPAEPLTPATADVVGSPWGVLAFDGDRRGFVMGTTRARGLRFERV